MIGPQRRGKIKTQSVLKQKLFNCVCVAYGPTITDEHLHRSAGNVAAKQVTESMLRVLFSVMSGMIDSKSVLIRE